MNAAAPQPADELPENSDVGLFPLPDVVLLPGMLLPLLVFEARYRALIADAISDELPIGVPRLKPGYESEYDGTPPVFDTFGVGRLLEHRQLADGRYRILVRGMARVKLVEEIRTTPYRVARVRRIHDVHPDAATGLALASLRPELERLSGTLARRVAHPADVLLDAIKAAESTGECADLVASTLVANVDLRQALLEELEPLNRMTALIAYLGETLERLAPNSTKAPNWN